MIWFYFYNKENDKCNNYYCYNGGTCYIDNYGNAQCKCTNNYNGYNCQNGNFF